MDSLSLAVFHIQKDIRTYVVTKLMQGSLILINLAVFHSQKDIYVRTYVHRYVDTYVHMWYGCVCVCV